MHSVFNKAQCRQQVGITCINIQLVKTKHPGLGACGIEDVAQDSSIFNLEALVFLNHYLINKTRNEEEINLSISQI